MSASPGASRSAAWTWSSADSIWFLDASALAIPSRARGLAGSSRQRVAVGGLPLVESARRPERVAGQRQRRRVGGARAASSACQLRDRHAELGDAQRRPHRAGPRAVAERGVLAVGGRHVRRASPPGSRHGRTGRRRPRSASTPWRRSPSGSPRRPTTTAGRRSASATARRVRTVMASLPPVPRDRQRHAPDLGQCVYRSIGTPSYISSMRRICASRL